MGIISEFDWRERDDYEKLREDSRYQERDLNR